MSKNKLFLIWAECVQNQIRGYLPPLCSCSPRLGTQEVLFSYEGKPSHFFFSDVSGIPEMTVTT